MFEFYKQFVEEERDGAAMKQTGAHRLRGEFLRGCGRNGNKTSLYPAQTGVVRGLFCAGSVLAGIAPSGERGRVIFIGNDQI